MGIARNAMRAMSALRAQAYDWLRSVRFTVHALKGRTPHGYELCILYAGGAPYRHYLRNLAFADGGREQALGRYWRWELPSLAARLDADVRVTRCARAIRRMCWPKAPSFYVPEWLWSEVRLGPAAVRRTGKTWSRIRRHRLTYSVTRDTSALNHFYDRMYVPFIKSSHGDGAQLMRRDDMLQRVARGEGELISIVQDGTAVGGCFVVYEHGEARLFSQGILDGDPDYLRQRVGVAIYVYSFAYLFERGFGHVNLGRSRPFLSDGVLRFKLERGAVLTRATSNGIEIEPVKATPALRKLLLANPWVTEDADGLVATFVADIETAQPTLSIPSGVARQRAVPFSGAPKPLLTR